jgi:hypothetical protein
MDCLYKNNTIPKEKRLKDNNIKGNLDSDGFFRTPNGSFWDPDGEYFNRFGYDTHGGSYVNVLDYIPGPDWLSELGCYLDEKEKYLNQDNNLDDLDDDDMDKDLGNADQMVNELMKGDFEGDDFDDFNDGSDDIGISLEDLKKLNIDPGLLDKKLQMDTFDADKFLQSLNITSNSTNITGVVKAVKVVKTNKKSNNKKKKNKAPDDDEWESADDELQK